MKILDTLKGYLPVSRATHEAELKKERERLNITLASRQKEIEAERDRQMEKLHTLVAGLVNVRWRRDEQFATFGLEMNISAHMLRYSNDPDHRRMLAESIGYQVRGEILRSHFIQ